MMITKPLNGSWQCRGGAYDFTCSIPGTVHTGLIENGLVPDLFWRDNAAQYEWIGRQEWSFSRTVCVTEPEAAMPAELAFDGLDTYCAVYLNGEKAGEADDMFLSYRFDITGKLKPGENHLELRFTPPEEAVKDKDFSRVSGPFNGSSRLYIRRMQCTFGWDWVHDFVTMGIWKDVRLVLGHSASIASLRAATKTIDTFGAAVELLLETRITTQEPIDARLTVVSPDGDVVWSHRRRVIEPVRVEEITVEQPALWYPAGYGGQPLYTLRAELTGEGGAPIDVQEIRFGIRTLRILQIKDKPGSKQEAMAKALYAQFVGQPEGENEYMSFVPLVNETPVLCLGANWVPAEPFPGSAAREKHDHLLQLAREGNCNMLRVWGGGIFEDDAFYDRCDELGILVTQDFLMACGNYPAFDAQFCAQYEAECVQAVKRLRHHACLAWWTGDNENQMGKSDDLQNNARALAAIAGMAVRRHDPQRTFFLSSPVGGSDCQSPAQGTTHYTGYLDYFMRYIRNTDMHGYAAHFAGALGRFANETPVLCGISKSSLEKFMTPDDLMGRDIFDFHTKNHPADEYREVHLFDHLQLMADLLFGAAQNAEQRVHRLGFAGYEWVRAIMESVRRNADFCRGNLFWMFNDCWPAIGWSMVDYYGLPKGSWYAMKRTAQPTMVSIGAEDGMARAVVSNYGAAAVSGTGRLYLQGSEDEIGAAREFHFAIEPEQSAVVAEAPADIPKGAVLLCDIETANGCDRARYLPQTPVMQELPAANVTMRREDGVCILETDRLAFGVCLDGEFIFADNYFELVPGEQRRIPYRPSYRQTDDTIRLTWLNQE